MVSEIHRYLARNHCELCKILGVNATNCISDTQLRRVLTLVDAGLFQEVNANYFGFGNQDVPSGCWISYDGKEIRGTIDGITGEKRGLNIVYPFVHDDKITLSGLFYNGLKDSEINCVRELLMSSLAKHASIFDALHAQHETLSMIAKVGGRYMAQFKDNQKGMLEDFKDSVSITQPFDEQCSEDKAHGRLEQRKATFYDISGICYEPHWQACNLSTLVVMERQSLNVKTQKSTKEISYYATNITKEQIDTKEVFRAIRNHWQIESNNYLRDCTFREDKIQCFEHKRIKTISVMISLATNLFRNNKTKNIKAQTEKINSKTLMANELLKKIKFL